MTQKIKQEDSVQLKHGVDEKVKQSRFKSLFISCGFAVLLIMPTLDQWLGMSAGFVSTEKRTLTPFPTFHYPHVRTFIAEFTQYYKENFGWRNALFYQYSRWKYHVLHTSPLPEKVIIGKNGWFYPGNNMNQVLDRHRGATIHPDTLLAVTRRLTTYQQQLAAQGTKLYLLVVPDSYTIYPENLPDYLQGADSQVNFERIKACILRHTTIPFVDIRKPLMSAKSHHVVYFQTDTHWNFYGSLVGTLELVNRVRQDFPKIPAPRLSDYLVQPVKGHGGDLVMLFAMNDDLADSIQYNITVPKPFNLNRQLVESAKARDINVQDERFVGSSADLPKLLLINDSFSYWMRPFLPGYFSQSYLVGTHKLDTNVAKAERPNVVIIEIVERNFDMLGV